MTCFQVPDLWNNILARFRYQCLKLCISVPTILFSFTSHVPHVGFWVKTDLYVKHRTTFAVHVDMSLKDDICGQCSRFGAAYRKLLSFTTTAIGTQVLENRWTIPDKRGILFTQNLRRRYSNHHKNLPRFFQLGHTWNTKSWEFVYGLCPLPSFH